MQSKPLYLIIDKNKNQGFSIRRTGNTIQGYIDDPERYEVYEIGRKIEPVQQNER